MAAKDDAKALKRAKFEHVFTVIRDELVDFFKSQNMPKDAIEWYTRVRIIISAFLAFRVDETV